MRTEILRNIIKSSLQEALEKKDDVEVFLGGTANNSSWRADLIPMLNIKYFDPIVDDWNEEAQKKELEKRESCDYVLYVITPKMEGVYSIAEAVQDSNKQPDKTVFCVLEKDENKEFSEHQIKSLDMVKKMIEENGAAVCSSLKEVAKKLNV